MHTHRPPSHRAGPIGRRLAAGCRAAALLALAGPALAAADATPALPDTATGRVARQLLQQVDSAAPAQLEQWLPGILSDTIGNQDKAAFVAGLVSAARDGGGLEVFDVRADKRHPGVLGVAVKARRDGRPALLWLTADPDTPGRLSEAMALPMDDPALYAGWPAQGGATGAGLTRLLQGALDRLAQHEDFSGCLTVQQAGSVVFDECRGLAERNFGVPADHRTRFHIGSINKMFTAVAIAQLVEAGKLSWDDTLARHLPEYPDQAGARRITLWQLLHHTAGLGDFLVPEYFADSQRFVDPGDYLDLIARQPRVAEPGTQWNYSNAGYMLLGRIVEKASAEPYDHYLQRHVFAPAQMHDSGFDTLDQVVPRLAVGYYRDGLFSSTWKAAWLKLGYKGGPAGGGYSSNADLLRFAQALRTGKLVTPATLERMFADPVPAGPGGYAAGFGQRLSHGRHIRGHAGGIEGTTANLAMVWETGATVALTSNQGESQNWMLAERIADLLAASAPGP